MDSPNDRIVVVVKRQDGENTYAGAVDVVLPKRALAECWGIAAAAIKDLERSETSEVKELVLLVPLDCPPNMERTIAKCLRAACAAVRRGDAKETGLLQTRKRKLDAIVDVVDILKDVADEKSEEAAKKLRAILAVATKEDIPSLSWALVDVVFQVLNAPDGGWLAKVILADDAWDALVCDAKTVECMFSTLKFDGGRGNVRAKLAYNAVIRLLNVEHYYARITGIELPLLSVKSLVDSGELRPETSLREPWAVETMAVLVRQGVAILEWDRERLARSTSTKTDA